MKDHDLQFEKLHIPVTVGFSPHRFDFVVGSFEPPCRQTIKIKIGQDAVKVLFQSSGEFLQQSLCRSF
jgi:hypothetical protein